MGTVPQVAWLIAAVCFILSLGGLSRHESARRGNFLGIVGMMLAIGAAFWQAIESELLGGLSQSGLSVLAFALVAGGIVGGLLAVRVAMTGMPQLVAILHSFVGLAAVLVGFSVFLHGHGSSEAAHGVQLIHDIEIFLGVFIGGLTFTGSVVAWGKLDGKINSRPLLIPGRHAINVVMLLVCVLLGAWFIQPAGFASELTALLIMLLISFVFGAHLVMAIGGADMPVVVSMLNSYSGWAAAATGFMLSNDLLIITGALVGSSGAILSYIMCHAMNRSFLSVILGGFGTGTAVAATSVDRGELVHTATTADEVAEALKNAKEVIVVPGYGMAVAQAQHPIREITELLQANGTRTRFAIHPVAGRLPGHMNVLLAEARLPYDLVLEMDEINEDFPNTDVVLVVGANDIVNPGALDDPSSPIYGMPVLEAWKAKEVVVFKRSMGSGYSGVDNPLFYNENTDMLFGDAKKSSDDILQALRR
ncbi:MAG: NAD(P)(+) transhydrogenase (Re/Si-specific) subunit beta [Planctomycetaceae bacterium]|nr:NAD(P)(+) transhydrogenase (Re/Si-specific) subunit beta [Planctomycetaceae bacterium]MCP4476670.1 NAD(P)(+) transhydrogenase (Re/Si-specific) subunit beta [Planctomycetaceae bacterium]